jgi:hypothetical protein
MHTGLSSQVTGFYAKKKVGGILSRKLSCLAPGPARPDPRPDYSAPDWTIPAADQTGVLARYSAQGRIRLAGRRTSGLQPGPAGLFA